MNEQWILKPNNCNKQGSTMPKTLDTRNIIAHAINLLFARITSKTRVSLQRCIESYKIVLTDLSLPGAVKKLVAKIERCEPFGTMLVKPRGSRRT